MNAVPNWRGKVRLLHLLKHHLVAEIRPGVWVNIDPRVRIEVSLLYNRLRFDHEELGLIYNLLRPGMTFVDVGAFVGVMALAAASKVGASGRVVAFEAGAPSLVRLARNRELNGFTNLTICATAVGDRRGFIDYYYCDGSPDQSSIGYHQPGEHAHPVLVPMAPLDGCLRDLGVSQVDLIKIDVEGSEPAVLAGAEEMLSGPEAPLVLLELNPAALEWAGNSATQVVQLLHKFGYELWALELPKSGAYVNVIGVKKGHAQQFPQLPQYLQCRLLSHEWYHSRVVAGGHRVECQLTA